LKREECSKFAHRAKENWALHILDERKDRTLDCFKLTHCYQREKWVDFGPFCTDAVKNRKIDIHGGGKKNKNSPPIGARRDLSKQKKKKGRMVWPMPLAVRRSFNSGFLVKVNLDAFPGSAAKGGRELRRAVWDKEEEGLKCEREKKVQAILSPPCFCSGKKSPERTTQAFKLP